MTSLILAVLLTWIAPGDDGNVGTATEYDLRVSVDSITEDNWDIAGQVIGEPIPQVAGSAESCAVTGLSPRTTYYFAIKGVDEAANWSELSNVVSVEVCPCDTSDVMRFDVDCSGIIDISDLMVIIEYMFGG